MDQEMKYVDAVYRCGSFSRAAQELFLTQPALSIAVAKTEARLGMPLFDRTAKPLRLTAAGELYLTKYREIRNLERELEQQLNDLSSLRTGRLRIGGSHYFNSYVLPPVLARFTEKYPGVRLELTETGADRLLSLLYDQEIDLTFNCTEKPKDSFLRTPCFTDTLLLSVPRDSVAGQRMKDHAFTARDILEKRHRLPDAPEVSIEAFADLPYLILTPGNDLRRRSLAMFEEAGIQPRVRMQVSQLVTTRHLSAAGLGAAFITDLLITHPEEETLFFRISSPYSVRVFDLVLSDRQYVSHAMQAFSEMMLAYYSSRSRST